MRILIIGGTNFMGPLVVRTLSEQGHEVTVFHRCQTRTHLPYGVKEILGDRRSLNEKAPELRQLAPDVLLDMVTSQNHYAGVSMLNRISLWILLACARSWDIKSEST